MRAIAAVTTPGETAALCHSVGLARASFYRRRRPTPSLPPPPSRAPSPRALAADERQAMLDTLHSECQRSFKFPPPAVIENSPTPG